MDRISALDTAFLAMEGPDASLNIGSIGFFEGPPPARERIEELIARRLPLAPRLRQRLMPVPFTLGRPVWADDPDFELSHHLHFTTLPAPGGPDELGALVEEILSRHLDQDRPLWEDWIIDGLADGTWVIVAKVHHAMVDGIAGVGLLTALFDDDADPSEDSSDTWRPQALPGPVRLVSDAVIDGWRDNMEAMTLRPGNLRRLPRTVWNVGRGLIRFGGALRPTKATALIGEIGPARSYRHTSVPISTVLDIRKALGGTINDVVVAAAARGYRDLLLAMGDEPTPESVRVMIPVSVRRGEDSMDNRVSALLLELPVELADPMDRFTEVVIRMSELKGSHQADAGEWLTNWGDLWPAATLRRLLEATFRAPQQNLSAVITNVPGPTGQLRFADRTMLAAYPYVPISFRLRASVAVSTYGDQVLIGVTGDRGSVPDLTPLVSGIEAGFEELAQLAARAGEHS